MLASHFNSRRTRYWLAAAFFLANGMFALLPANASHIPSRAHTPPVAHIALHRPIASSAFPLTLSDALGRRVSLPRRPNRIISLAPSVTENLFAIGAGSLLVGDTVFDNFPAAAAKVARVGDMTHPSVESILALRPDLVVGARINSLDTIQALSRRDIPVFTFDPHTLSAAAADLRLLGRLTGRTDGANTAARSMEKAMSDVAASIRTAKPVSCLVEVSYGPLFLAGPNSFIGDLIKRAGGRNLAPRAGSGFPQVSGELVLALNPAVYFAAENGVTSASIASRPGWSHLAAVRTRRVHSLPADIVSRPTPRIIQALRLAARALHPDAFHSH